MKAESQVLQEVRRCLETLATDGPTSLNDRLLHLSNLCSGLDLRLEYPPRLVRAYDSPLSHMVGLLAVYFHGADAGDDETIRAALFSRLATALPGHPRTGQDMSWVIPDLADPLLEENGWGPDANPAGVPYSLGLGRLLAPFMPKELHQDLLSCGPSALKQVSRHGKRVAKNWMVFEQVSDPYLALVAAGALPFISHRALSGTANDLPSSARPGPRL